MIELIVHYPFNHYIAIKHELQTQGYICEEPIKLDMSDETPERLIAMQAISPSLISALDTWCALTAQPWYEKDTMMLIVKDGLGSMR